MSISSIDSRESSSERLERLVKSFVVRIIALLFGRPHAGLMDKCPVQSVLVIRQHDQLGDMLCAVPLLHALRQCYPAAHIALVCSPVNFEIMRSHPYLDEVLNYDKRLFFKSPSAFVSFLSHIRRRRFSLVVVPATVSISLTSDLLARWSAAPLRIGPSELNGFANDSSFCYTHPVRLDWSADPNRHQSRRNLDILAPLGIESSNLDTIIGITEEERFWAEGFAGNLREGWKCIIGIHPGAGKPENKYPAGRLALLADALQKRFDAAILITAGPMDDEALNVILSAIKAKYTLIRNQPLRRVAALLDQLDLFVSNDTGIMHVAAATRTGVVALFGPTDSRQWMPLGSKNHAIQSPSPAINGIPLDEIISLASSILESKLLQKSVN